MPRIDDVIEFFQSLEPSERIEVFESLGELYPHDFKMSQLTRSERKFYTSKLKRG